MQPTRSLPFLLAAVIFAPGPAFAQSPPPEKVAPTAMAAKSMTPLPFWKSGDKMNYRVEQTASVQAAGKPETKFGSRGQLSVEVLSIDDNTVRLKASPQSLFEEFLAPAKSPLVCFRHHERDCVYDEADVVIMLNYDAAERVNYQMSLYRYLGYPAGNGLAKTTLLLRRHHEPALQRAMDLWSGQTLAHSKRDQLSMLPSCWFVNFEIEYLRRRFDRYELLDWPVIKDGLRLPRDFDEATYLDLNPDLASIGMDLRKHYLLHGLGERRRYRKFELGASADRLLRRVRRRIFRRKLQIEKRPG